MRHLLPLITVLAALTPRAAAAEGAPRWVRSPAAFARDVSRAAHRPVLDDKAIGGRGVLRVLAGERGGRRLVARLAPGARSPQAAVDHFSGRGPSRVALGNGVDLELRAHGPRVEELSVARGATRRSLLPRAGAGIGGVALDAEPAASPTSLRIFWPGPFNRLSVLGYLHERGHIEHFRQLSKKQRDAIETAGAFAAFGTPLTRLQKRTILGAERQAWANAFRQLRRIRRAGIPLLSDVPDRTLRRLAHGLLDGYAQHLGRADTID